MADEPVQESDDGSTMSGVWIESGDEALASRAASLGASVSERAEASVWLLGGSVDAAAQTARGARPDQIVVFFAAPTEAEAAWAHLGETFDEVLDADASAAELTARVGSRLHNRRSEPRSRILRLLAHDLNNPLTAIRLLSEMLAAEVPGDEARQDVRDILEASDVAASLVESLSAYARLLAPEPARATNVDVGAVISEASRRPCNAGQFTVHAPRTPVHVRGDRAAVKQAVFDVLLNARRLSESSGTTEVTLTDSGTEVVIEVVCRLSTPTEGLEALLHDYGSMELRSQRVPVSPTGLAHAARTAESVGGRLDLETHRDRLVTRLVLPAAH